MRIAQIAPVVECVPPARYGGTERIVSTLTEELVRRGHDVTLFASADSHTAARLVPVVEHALWANGRGYTNFGPFFQIALGRLVAEIGRFDIVHSHVEAFAYPLARLAPCPVVSTLHGRLDLPELVPLYAEFDDLPLVSISDSQRRPIPRANWVATVHHGIEVQEFTFTPRRGDYLAFLGRVAPEKGLDTAIRVARRAGLPLKIAARMPLPFTDDPNVRADREHWERDVQPLLDGPDVEFVGPVGGRDKDAFLGGAAALLFPIRWPEPFGLVMPEALACGTPVLALDQGSVPEVIEHGATGFVCADEDGLVRAVGRLGELDRARCRAAAEERFSAARMAEAYLRVYRRLLDGWSPPPAARRGTWTIAEALAEADSPDQAQPAGM